MYPNVPSRPNVGVAIIVRKGDQVLLLRRKNVHGAGSWSTPGGHLDFGESPEQCAIREAKEETNLDLGTVGFVAITNDVFEAENKHYISVWMESWYLTGEAILNAPYESDAIGWFRWDDLPQPLFIPFQHLVNGECYPVQSIAKRFGINHFAE
jgi:8-oxo-dGTP diphosphatase